VVELPSLTDFKLDGKAMKLETLLQLAPWYRPLTQQPPQQPAADTTASDPPAQQEEKPSSPSRARRVSVGDEVPQSGAKKKGKPPKDPKVVEFCVKAAAVLVGRDPPVMPDSLLAWAAEVGLHARVLGLSWHTLATEGIGASGHEWPRGMGCEVLMFGGSCDYGVRWWSRSLQHSWWPPGLKEALDQHGVPGTLAHPSF
jgi:hypothetical protein